MLLMEKCFPGEAGIAILESWKKGQMSQCQDGRSLPGLLVGQRARRRRLHCASTAWPAIRLSTQNAQVPDVLGNTPKAMARRSVAIQELHYAFDKRAVGVMIVPNWRLSGFTN